MEEEAVLFLCGEEDLRQEQLGYARAFKKQCQAIYWPAPYKSLRLDLFSFVQGLRVKLKLILYPDIFPFLPWGLTKVEVPTACFQIDTFGGTASRIRHSRLFDYAFVFHPDFEKKFLRRGHPRAVMLAHAVDAALFKDILDKRSFEVGWVGRSDYKIYTRRRRILKQLSARFCMNDWQRKYSQEEMAQVYKSSKIVVNISRDDYPQDANLRVFETMAAGALLITGSPTELSQLGFTEHRHFVGYQDEEEIIGLVSYYLKNDQERYSIAQAGRQKVLGQDTYDRRVGLIWDTLRRDNGRLFAPARNWPEADVRQVYLEYYATYAQLGNAIEQLRHLKKFGFRVILRALPFFGLAILRVLRRFFWSLMR